MSIVRVKLCGKLKHQVVKLLSHSPSFRDLLNYVSRGDVELNEVKKLVKKVNIELKGEQRIYVRKTPYWVKAADYCLVLTHKRGRV